jgi:hypothetical protein
MFRLVLSYFLPTVKLLRAGTTNAKPTVTQQLTLRLSPFVALQQNDKTGASKTARWL